MAVRGRVTLLRDLYAFALLGAVSVTCLCLDIVRWRRATHWCTTTDVKRAQSRRDRLTGRLSSGSPRAHVG